MPMVGAKDVTVTPVPKEAGASSVAALTFACTQCSYTTIRKADLARHVRSHTGEKPFACDKCECVCQPYSRWTPHT